MFLGAKMMKNGLGGDRITITKPAHKVKFKLSFKFSDILFIIKVNNYICGGFASKVCTLLIIDLKVKLIGTDLHCIGCLQGHGNPRVFL